MTIVACVLLVVVVWWGVEATEHVRSVVEGVEYAIEDPSARADAFLQWMEDEAT